MSLKKLALLATAVCALVAFAVPASASATHTPLFTETSDEFTDDTEPITGEVSVLLHGEMTFINIFGGYKCTVESEVDVNSEDATATSFDINTEDCVGEGVLAGCELVEDSTTIDGQPIEENPATINIVDEDTTDEETNIIGTHETRLTIEGPIVIHNTFDPECEIEEVTLTFDEFIGEPEIEDGYLNAINFDEENFENEGISDITPLELPTVAGGTLRATQGYEDTISID